MTKPTSHLSSEFFVSKGVLVTRPLREWLNRASYLSKTRTCETDRRKYERWAIGIVEDALRSPGGIEGKDWDRMSPVMPTDAIEREPAIFLVDSSHSVISKASTHSVALDYRNELFAECMRRAPAELRSFIMHVFERIDIDVKEGRRKYDSLSFMEVVQTAQELQRTYRTQGGTTHKVSSVTNSFLGTKIPREQGEDERKRKMRCTEVTLVSAKGNRHVDLMTTETVPQGGFFFRDLLLSKTQSTTLLPFVGKSKALERMYSRYEPTPDDIRPRNVLVKALDFVLAKASEKEKLEGPIASAQYLNEQFKGMRQDLRVQNIADEFAVEVYERHALICLQIGDIGEFNQCQASLKKLYDELPVDSQASTSDFFCYRLAYLCLGGQYDALSTELINYTNTTSKGVKGSNITPVKKSDLRWTIKLCTACEDGDSFTISRSLMALPHGMHLLVKIYLQRCRMRWLRELLSCLKGMVSMRFIMSCLGFAPVVAQALHDGDSASNTFWLDGSFEEAEVALNSFFETIKFVLPKNFSFRKEIDSDIAKRNHGLRLFNGNGASIVDGTELFNCVDKYISYLGTRRDARLGEVN